jgi:hypothetical protein
VHTRWSDTGLSRLRGDLELYDAASTPASAYNRLLREEGPLPPGSLYEARGFGLEGCYGPERACLYRRPGGCRGSSPSLTAWTMPPVRAALSRLGFTVD